MERGERMDVKSLGEKGGENSDGSYMLGARFCFIPVNWERKLHPFHERNRMIPMVLSKSMAMVRQAI